MKRHESEIGSWMTAPAVTAEAQTSLLDAYNYMTENDIRRLPITDKNGFLVGILTMSDILRTVPSFFQSNEDLATNLLLQDQKVYQVMTTDPIIIGLEDTVQNAAEMMLEYQVSGLPVLVEGRVAGVITESDIFRLVVKSWGKLVPG